MGLRPVGFAALAFVLTGLGVRDLAAGSVGRMMAGAAEVYAGVSFATLALIYGMQSAGRDVGAMSGGPITPWLILPYRAIGRAILLVVRILGREPARNVLVNGIVVGRLPSGRERAALGREGIDAVLCLCWELPGLAAGGGLETARVPMLDAVPPPRWQLDEAVERVVRWRSEDRCILIHCAQGHGRTATVAAACLVRLGLAADARAALAAVRVARPGARPSRAQAAALADYAASIAHGPA